mgnify:CR=1 FL=1
MATDFCGHAGDVIEVDCCKCANVDLEADCCKLYGNDPDVATQQCAADAFVNYRMKT